MTGPGSGPAAGAAPWLVADIGATHARFAGAGDGGLVGPPLLLRTGDFATQEALLARVLEWSGAGRPDAACLAIAGPVENGRGRITNGSLTFDAGALTAALGCPVYLINDFQALARGLPELGKLQRIGGGQPADGGLKAVLGPGSGLGMSMLMPLDGGWRVLPSEGGHADLAPGNPLEMELLGILEGDRGHVCWEDVLSGPGLVRLYQAVGRLWGGEVEPVAPEWITARGITAEEPICHQTLEVFCGLLGSAAGNLALTTWATGGVYLGGGILPAMADFLADSPLRRRFEERGAMSGRFREVPLYLILDPAPGLVGARAWLADLASA